MNKYFTIPFLVFIILLVGCSAKEPTIVYKGEGSGWEATYNYQEISKNSYEFEILLKYKNDVQELKELEEITIEYSAGTSTVGGTIPISLLNTDEQVVFKNSGAYEGVNLLHNDSKIEVFIQWGNNKDSFVLENVNNKG